MAAMTKGERSELKTLLRRRYKQLRSDVLTRRAELVAEVEQAVVERHRARDMKRGELEQLANDVTDEATRKIRDAFAEAGYDLSGMPRMRAMFPTISWSDDGRSEMRRSLIAQIDAQIAAAQEQLERQEVDLLQTLTLDGIESDAAKAFLASIPTVGELVPTSRMQELEAAIAPEADPGVSDWYS